MAEMTELLYRLVGSPKALSEMEKDLHAFLSEQRMHGTVNCRAPDAERSTS